MNWIGLQLALAICLAALVSGQEQGGSGVFGKDGTLLASHLEHAHKSDEDQQVDSRFDDDLDDLFDEDEHSDGEHRKTRTQACWRELDYDQIMKSFQLGIATSVNALASKPERDLLLKDFKSIDEVSFPKTGSEVTPAHNYYYFKFKTYAPLAYQNFRAAFGLDIENYLSSVGKTEQPLRALSNPGKSGSALYLTRDDKFIIKTVSLAEADFLLKLLPEYYMNLKQNPSTLLPKLVGQYGYTGVCKHMRFIIMNNLLPSAIRIDEKYDLKGSTFGRTASDKERSKSLPTFKDLDFIESHKNGFTLEPEVYDSLMKVLDADLRVLESFKIVDFSLLLGVHYMDKVEKETLLEQMALDAVMENHSLSAIQAKDENGKNVLLFMGIIDVLVNYNVEKKLEHTLKSMVHDANSISIHNPSHYRKRFHEFMATKVFKRG